SGFPNRPIRPRRLSAKSAPPARSNGKALSSTSAAPSSARQSPWKRPKPATGKSVSSTPRSASSIASNENCVVLPSPCTGTATRRPRPNHEKLSPIHPVSFVTHLSAGHPSQRDGRARGGAALVLDCIDADHPCPPTAATP